MGPASAYRFLVLWLQVIGVYAVVLLVTWTVYTMPSPARLLRPFSRRRVRRVPRLGHELPDGRAIELIVRDVRRLGPRFHHPPRGTSATKIEALRYAYDRALGEAARALEVEHLLGVLPPGAELDLERGRVESALWLAGFRIDEPA